MSGRVAIVDDYPGFRAHLRRLIEMLPGGYAVVGEAGSGLEALMSLPALHPDLIILDMDLPDTSGLGVAKAIAASLPNARLVVLSLYDLTEYRAAVQALGHRFVTKLESFRELPRILAAFQSEVDRAGF